MNRHLRAFHALIAVGSMMLSACDEKEPSPAAPIWFYTIEVDNLLWMPDWVFATDGSGEVLDVERVTELGSVHLYGEIQPGASFTLHFLTVDELSYFKTFTVRSFADAPFGGTSQLLGNSISFEPRKEASVTIDNWPSSGEEHKIHTTVSSASGVDSSEGTTPITFLIQGTSDVVVSSLIDDRYHYALLEDVAPLDARTTSLRPVDRTLTINLEENATYPTVSLSGYYSGQSTRQVGYINSRYYRQVPAIPIMGYINGFDQYRTTISYVAWPIRKTYVKLGDPLEKVPPFDSPKFVIASGDLNAFAATVSIPYHMAEIQFSHKSDDKLITWNVLLKGNGDTSPLAFSMKSLPPAITEAYPELVQDLTLDVVAIAQFLDDFRYNKIFDGLYPEFVQGYSLGALSSREHYTYEFFDF